MMINKTIFLLLPFFIFSQNVKENIDSKKFLFDGNTYFDNQQYNTAEYNYRSSQGTSIVEAIQLSSTYFDDENQANRIVCILSDGEDHEYQENLINTTIQDSGIIIFSIGVGSKKGSPIPIRERNIVKSYKKDEKGDVVITKLNSDLLKKLADQSKGKYIEGEITSDVVEEIISQLKEMDKKEFEAKEFTSFKDQFQWFLAISLFLILIDSFLFEKKTKWIEKLNLFNDDK